MAPRPAFLSNLGGGVPTGLKPPSQRDKPKQKNNKTTQVSSFFNVDPGLEKGFIGTETKPKKTYSDSASFANFIGNQQSGGDNSGIQAFQQTQQGGSGGGSGSNIAQQVLGDAYNQAIGLGYKPSELINMVNNANQFGRGLNVDKFKTDLDRYEGFLDADGDVFKFDDPQDDGSTVTRQYLSVSRPELSANAPTLAQLLGDIGGGISNLFGAGADFIMGGGTAGKIFQGLQDKFNQSKDFVGELINPGNLSQRLDAAGPEARRKYAFFLSQGDPYQIAFQKATGQSFVQGGIATLQ